MQLSNENIRQLRERNGLTLAEFAGIVGISKSHLSLIERGKRTFSVDLLDRICREFKIKPEALAVGFINCAADQPSPENTNSDPSGQNTPRAHGHAAGK